MSTDVRVWHTRCKECGGGSIVNIKKEGQTVKHVEVSVNINE